MQIFLEYIYSQMEKTSGTVNWHCAARTAISERT